MMETQVKQNQLDEINRKLDLVVAQLEENKKRNREFQEFKDDFARFSKDIFRSE